MRFRVRQKPALWGGALTLLLAIAVGVFAVVGSAGAAEGGANVDWPYWGGTTQGANDHYADINQINTSNVGKLGEAFDIKAGTNTAGLETDPQEVNGVLYYTTPTDQVFAVNATTGKKIWSYTPKVNFFLAIAGGGGGVPNSRGVTIANGKVYDLTFDDQLIALQQSTGEKLWSHPIAAASKGISESSPGVIYKNEYIVGGAESDAGIRGSVQAFNTSNGKLLWRTQLVPKPGQGWMPAKGEHGGGDVWMPPTVDPKTGQVFVGTGNPSPDFDSSVRPGCDPWVDATVALNAKTGKFEWGHTEVCNDSWDYDSHQSPVVYTTTVDGQQQTVVGQVNKSGFFSIMNEKTGKLIAKSPYVTKYSTPHLKPNAKGVKVCPGATGGIEYSPTTVDPQTGFAYEQTLNECDIYSLQPQSQTATHKSGQPDFGGSFKPAPGKTSGGFVAINDATGKIMWKDHLPVEAAGGSTSTSGGVVFFTDGDTLGTSVGGHFMAADAKTGKILLNVNLGVPLSAAPMTYEVNGTQYVALAADSDIVVFKLGGKRIKKVVPSVPQTTTPASNLPDLSKFKKVGQFEYVNAAGKQVVFKLTSGVHGKNNGFNFDGYYGGQANFEVPVGWVVTYEFTNAAAIPHSIQVTDSLKTPLTSITSALGSPEQSPSNPLQGTKQGSGISVVSIDTTKPQSLFLVCGVAGHLQAGMWDRMTVSNSVSTPKIVVGAPTKKLP